MDWRNICCLGHQVVLWDQGGSQLTQTMLCLRDATANAMKIIQNNEDLKDASMNICLLLNTSNRGITTSDDKCLAKMINLSDLGWHLQWVELTLKMPWRIHWIMWVEQHDKLYLMCLFPLKNLIREHQKTTRHWVLSLENPKETLSFTLSSAKPDLQVLVSLLKGRFWAF